MEASIVIVTKNRKEELRRALASCLKQDTTCEILVVDDASTDGTVNMVKEEFGSVRLICHAKSGGYITRRNQAAHLATGRYIISIDDDAEFSTPSIVQQVLSNFDDPHIAAISIPHADVRISSRLKTPTPNGAGRWVVASYIGTAHAVRRDIFLVLGGYREALLHNSEERDFCIRLLDHGYVVRLGTGDPIFHHTSPIRDSQRGRMLERRNDICHGFWDVPVPHIFYYLPGTIINGLIYGTRNRCLLVTLRGYFQAPWVCLRSWRERKPVSGKTYKLFRKLNRQRAMLLGEAEKLLRHTNRAKELESTAAEH